MAVVGLVVVVRVVTSRSTSIYANARITSMDRRGDSISSERPIRWVPCPPPLRSRGYGPPTRVVVDHEGDLIGPTEDLQRTGVEDKGNVRMGEYTATDDPEQAGAVGTGAGVHGVSAGGQGTLVVDVSMVCGERGFWVCIGLCISDCLGRPCCCCFSSC